MDKFATKKAAILGGCFLVRSALELILSELELPFVTAGNPLDVPPDATVLLLSFASSDELLDGIASSLAQSDPPRIVLFPQHPGLLESIRALPSNVAAVVGPDLATSEIKSVISLVAEGLRIVPFASNDELAASNIGTEAPAQIRPGLLTDRQLEILREVAKGQSNKAIARKFCISINTVEAHVSRIIRKLRVDNRTQAALALRAGLPPVARTANQIARNSGHRSTAFHNLDYH